MQLEEEMQRCRKKAKLEKYRAVEKGKIQVGGPGRSPSEAGESLRR